MTDRSRLDEKPRACASVKGCRVGRVNPGSTVSCTPVIMLRVDARRRAGLSLDEDKAKRLESWRAMLETQGAVVHSDPDTADGFSYIPRGPGDKDIIRKPPTKTTQRRNADERA